MTAETTTGGGGDGDGDGGGWRREAEERLRRLHSLLFGADLALGRGDPAAARSLSLRLLGLLHPQTLTLAADAALLAPIRADAAAALAAASRALAPDSDRGFIANCKRTPHCEAFKQARRDVGHVFLQRGDIDIEKVKQSKYFRAFLHECKGNTTNHSLCQQAEESQLDRQHEKLSARATRLMTQTKITSIYGSKPMKASHVPHKEPLNSDRSVSKEYIDVDGEAPINQNSSQAVPVYLQVEENQKPSTLALRVKRRHTEFTSPICENVHSPSSNDEADTTCNGFVTARTKLEMDARQRHGLKDPPGASISPQSDYNPNTRNYGIRPGGIARRGLRGNFVPPVRNNGGNTGNMISSRVSGNLDMLCGPDGELPEKLRNLEPRLIEHVSNEIMDKDPNVRWDDIAGLEHAKKCVTEMVIWPLLRPDIFRGCRSPGRGLLLFGPPGTGKTMIGKAIAGEAKATFFYISASSLTSKWIGEGEKLVRALFGVASCRQPAVIFVDEIDSLLSQRKSEGEHESSRRLKTQFLIEMEGFDSGNEQILLIGATNRPQELDEAARRRLTKRLYIPLPSSEARTWIVRNLLEKDGLFTLSEEDTAAICKLTEGYSGSDMKNLVKDASMGPLREALRQGFEITKLRKEDMRPVTLKDFEDALQEVRPSVSLTELGIYEEWNRQFGSLSI
ncbi:Fidgetin-like protein 1 [Ananas comosus]|uniref:Fidgetin-like protein 1 n=1 Tax=Ananas comosus TaxID=4615 RepID=A0A199UH61_ANACO|nr:Fidgetin-like protein 1 [Ananas comosus]